VGLLLPYLITYLESPLPHPHQNKRKEKENGERERERERERAHVVHLRFIPFTCANLLSHVYLKILVEFVTYLPYSC
jgi:hypothetical protein